MLSGTKDFLKEQIMKNGLSELENTTSLSFIQGIGNLLQSFSNAMRQAPGMDDLKRVRNLKFSKSVLYYLSKGKGESTILRKVRFLPQFH